MTSWIEAIAVWLADFSFASTVLLAGAAAILAIDRQPVRRRAVAWTTCFGLLLVAVLSTITSYPRLHLRSPNHSRDPVAVPLELNQSAPVVAVSASIGASNDNGKSARFEPPLVAPERSQILARPSVNETLETGAAPRGETLVMFVVGIYLTGTLLVAIWLSIGALEAFRLVRRSTAAPAECVESLRAIAGASDSLPRLLVNRSLLTAVATGTFRPAILLPETLTESGRAHELKAVLLHEWAHIKNGDLWLLAFTRFLMNLLWAHPLYWWMRRRLRADQEFLADAAAAFEVGATDYAALLVEWARPMSQRPRVPGVGIWEAREGLAERVATILNRSDRMQLRCSGRARTSIVLSLTAISGFAAMLSVRPHAAESSQPVALASLPTPAEQSSTDITHLAADEIGGICVDQQKHPIAGADVLLYAVNFQEMTQRLVQQTSTHAKGRFKFTYLGPKSANEIVVARRKGLATFASYTVSRGKPLDISMRSSAAFRGTVRDGQGKPLAGVHVSFGTETSGGSSLVLPVDGIRCARTDAKGEFSVDDLEEFTYVRRDPPPGWRGGWGTAGPPNMRVVDPNYVEKWVQYTRVPGSVDIVLSDRAATISGQVVFGETGAPAAGVSVVARADTHRQSIGRVAVTGQDGRYRISSLPKESYDLWVSSAPRDLTSAVVDSLKGRPGQTTQVPLIRLVHAGGIIGQVVDDVTGKQAVGMTVNLQGIWDQTGKASSYFQSTKTDGQGKYRFAGLPPGKFNIFIKETGADVTAAAIDSLPVELSQTSTAPPIHLIRGGVLKGRVIDHETDKPLQLRDGEELGVRIYGPTRPWSGGGCDYAMVKKDGTFEMRLPRGKSSLDLTTLSRGTPFNPTHFDDTSQEVSVPDGGEVHVEFHVERFEPPKPKEKT